MKQITYFIIEKFRINSKTVSNKSDKQEYNEYGKGEFETLDIKDFVKEKFDIDLTDHYILEFYNKLKSYKIDTNSEFYHIKNENVDNKLSTKIYLLNKKDPNSKISIITIGRGTDSLQIKFHNFPKYNLFVIIFVKHHNGSLINEYFFYK